MTGISDGPRLTISLTQVDDLNLEKKAYFKTPEDRVAFLDAIKNAREQVAKGVLNPTLEIPQPANARSLGLLADKFSSSAIIVGGTLLDVMTILHEIGQQMRQTAKDSRAVAREAEVDKLMDAAAKIRQGANFAMASGIASGVMTIGGGIMSGVGAAKAGFTTFKGLQAANTGPTTTQLQNLNSTGTGTGTGTGGVSGQGSGPVIGNHRGGVTGPTHQRIQIGANRGPTGTNAPTGQQTGTGGVGGTTGTTGTTSTSQNTGAPQTVADTRTGQAQKQGMLADLRDKLLGSKYSDAAVQAKNVNVTSSLASTQLEGWKAASQIMAGAGQIIGGVLDGQAKMMDARRAELEAESKGFGYQAQEADEIVQKMLELMRDVRQKLGEIEQAQTQVQSKIWS